MTATRNLLPQPPYNGSIDPVLWNYLQHLSQWVNAMALPDTSHTASFTVGLKNFYPCDATSGAITVTLPAANVQFGKKYVIKKTDSSANAVTITPAGSDTIDGAATLALSTQWDWAEIVSDGKSQWYVASKTGGGGGTTSPLTTKGDVWGYSTTDARIPVGTDGTFLTSDSSQTLGVKWNSANTLTAGCLVLLHEYVASSSSSIDITSQITSGYEEYLIEVINLQSATNGVSFNILLSTDNGTTWLGGTTYQYMFAALDTAGTSTTTVSSGSAQITPLTSHYNGGAFGLDGQIKLFKPGNASGKTGWLWLSNMSSATTRYIWRHGAFGNTTTTAINAVRLIFGSGAIASGTVRIYGIAKSSNQMLMNPGLSLTTAGTTTQNVPTGVTAARIEIVGGGGGGGGSSASAGSGGGGGGERVRLVIPVTSGGTLSCTVGAAGIAGAANTIGGDGGATSVTSGSLTVTAAGGHGGNSGAGGGIGGAGGGRSGASAGGAAVAEGIDTLGGAGGGTKSTAGGAAVSSGGGGAASPWGSGGTGDGSSPASTAYGAGGGGHASGTALPGGAGICGAIFITWL